MCFKSAWLVLALGSLGWVPGIPGIARAQVEKTWVATYDGPGRGTDQPRALAVDREGSVIVSGDSNDWTGEPQQVVTIKYAPDGKVLWVASCKSPSGDSYCCGMAVAADGSVHVIVETPSGVSATSDYTTVKYGPDGEETWTRTTNGPTRSDDFRAGVAVDASGNVHVTLSGYAARWTSLDYATLKYAPDGQDLWVRGWDGPDSLNDEPSAIAVDADGNVVVTGMSYGTDTRLDYATVKYAPDGSELWAQRWNGIDNLDDRPSRVAVDADGNVYVTGASATVIGTGLDFATVKYSGAGEEMWVEYYDGTGSGGDWPTGIAIDFEGNVHVTGLSFGVAGTDYDYLTLKYTSHGEALWVQTYDGPSSGEDKPKGIAVDAEGNVVVTGSSSEDSGTAPDYATVKYAASGKELWVHRWAGPGAGYDIPCGVALDAAGNVLVAGTAASSDYATLKLGPDGDLLWVRTYASPGSTNEEATALHLDPGGRVVVTGRSEGGETGFDFATVEYDADGKQLWAERYDGPGNAIDQPAGLAVDAAGNVLVTGESYGTPDTDFDYATIKYAPDGRKLWAARYSGPGSGSDKPSAIVVDAAGDFFVTGESAGDDATGMDYATVKCAPDGQELWVKRWSGPGNRPDSAKGIALDSAGSACVTGQSSGTTGADRDYVTVKYAPDGAELWVRRWSGLGIAWDSPKGIAVDAAGNILVAGESSGGTRTRLDYATVKYAPDGSELWVRRYNGPGSQDDRPFGITVDSAGNAYVTGESPGLDATGLDCATVKYDPDGNEIWVGRHAGEDRAIDIPEAMTLDPAGNVIVAVEQEIASLYTLHTIVMYDPQGRVVWAKSQSASIGAIRADAQGAIYVAGRRGNDYATIKYETLPLKRGDVDGDGKTGITDAVVLLQRLFLGGVEPPCLDAADTDDTGALDVTDAIRLLGHLFQGGLAPEAPFAQCGRDATLDSIDCKAFKSCVPDNGVPTVTFHGVEFKADAFFWVVDRSEVMTSSGELEMAKRELARAIAGLPESVEFGIVFFDETAIRFPESGVPAKATPEMKAGATSFVEAAAPGLGSCPAQGLADGLRMANLATSGSKALIYVGDGSCSCKGEDEATYLRQTVQWAVTWNVQGIPIHCIGVADPWPIDEDFLRSLAKASEGTYTEVVR